jgi:hypothetical protein
MGIRFQAQPGNAADNILLHVNLKDPSNLLQQEVVGIIGVNLIYAIFHQRQDKESLLRTLLEEASPERIEIDYIEVRGPSFQDWNHEELLLALVREGLAEAVVFPSGNQRRPPSEVLRKRPIVLTPLVSERIESAQREMLSAAILKLKAEAGDAAREPLGLFAISTAQPDAALAPPAPIDLLRSVEALRALGNDVLISSYPEFYRVTSFVNRYTQAPVRFVVGVSALIRLFSGAHGTLEGRLLEGLAKLFAQNVRVYAYPMSPLAVQQSLPTVSSTNWEWELSEGLISIDQLHASPPLGHLFAYVLASKFVVPLIPKP